MGMNSLQRIETMLSGQAVDRCPWVVSLSAFGGSLIACPMPKYFSDPDAYVRGQTAVLEILETDVLFAPHSPALVAEVLGCEVEYPLRQPPVVTAPALQSVSDLERLPFVDIRRDSRLDFIYESLEILKKEHGRIVPLIAPVQGPLDLPGTILGQENWLSILQQDAAARDSLLHRCETFFVEYANRLLEAGASFLQVSLESLDARIVSRKEAKSSLIPFLWRVFSQVKGALILDHHASSVAPWFQYLQGLPNVVGLVVGRGDSLKELFSRLKPGFLLWGGMGAASLRDESRETLNLGCTRTLEALSSDSRFVFSLVGGDAFTDTPIENIRVIRDTVRAFPHEFVV
jgi:uroporphyrinogen-III decarboxylase